MPSQPSTWLIGSSTTWNGMNTPNSMQAEQHVAAAELPQAQHIAVDGAPQRWRSARREHHHHRVPEEGLQAAAVGAGAGARPGLPQASKFRLPGRLSRLPLRISSAFLNGGDQHHVQRQPGRRRPPRTAGPHTPEQPPQKSLSGHGACSAVRCKGRARRWPPRWPASWWRWPRPGRSGRG
jgi:hypothetical protein